MITEEIKQALYQAFIAGRRFGISETKDLWDVAEHRQQDYERIVKDLIEKLNAK